MDHETAAHLRLAHPLPTRRLACRRFLVVASLVDGVAGAVTGMGEDEVGPITTTATALHAVGPKRAAGRVTATIVTGEIGSPTQTYGENGMTANPETENNSGLKLTAAHCPTNLHRQQRMFLLPLLRPQHRPSVPFHRGIPVCPTTL